MPPYLRITGDIHGLVHSYVQWILKDQCKYSIQLGDLGFGYDYMGALSADHHKFIGGNHDNYDKYYDCPNALGSFGCYTLGKFAFYFIRGAYSIDARHRVISAHRGQYAKTWWHEEQLTVKQMEKALHHYATNKPRVMLSHEAPDCISKKLSNPRVLKLFGHNPDNFTTPTQELLQECLNEHRPSIWIFGHYHKSVTLIVENTTFICLAEKEYIDIDENGLCADHPELRFIK